jgi:hypothetical protein
MKTHECNRCGVYVILVICLYLSIPVISLITLGRIASEFIRFLVEFHSVISIDGTKLDDPKIRTRRNRIREILGSPIIIIPILPIRGKNVSLMTSHFEKNII